MEKFDVVVIGGGPGGYPAAIRAAQLGASVALVEREALGGTCLELGMYSDQGINFVFRFILRHYARVEMGIKADSVLFNYSTMVKRKEEVVSRLKNGVGQLLKANGVTVFEGTACFAGAASLISRDKMERAQRNWKQARDYCHRFKSQRFRASCQERVCG